MRYFASCACLFILACGGLFTPLLAPAAEYHWTAPGPASWPAPGNWTPTRTTALATDRLVFDGGGAVTVSNVPNVTIGQLVVSNGTQVTLNSGAGGNALTIAGDTGPDLEVDPGALLMLSGGNVLVVELPTGTTAAIGGSLAAGFAAHHFQAVDTDAIVIQSGGTASTLFGFSGNLFGTGTGGSGLNSVRFQSGSVYAHGAGANPFGAAQPASVVTFDPGSLYRLDAAITPSLSGRTYANFEYDGGGTINATGGSPCTMDSMVFNGGAFNFQLTGALNIHGSLRTRNTATVTVGPPSGSVECRLNGSAPQVVVDSTNTFANGLTFTPATTLVIDNPTGILFTGDHGVFPNPGTLQFVHGLLTNSITNPSFSAYMVQDPPLVITGASPTTGWYVGLVHFTLVAANPNRRVDFGSVASYSPMDLVFHGVSGTTRVGVDTKDPAPNPLVYVGNQLDPQHRLSKVWEIDFSDSTTYSSFDATLHFDAGSITPGTDPLQFVTRAFIFGPSTRLTALHPIFHSLTSGGGTTTSVSVLGVTRLRADDDEYTFVVGEPSVVRVSALDGQVVEGNGPGVTVPMRLSLSEQAVDPVAVNYQLTSGTATAGTDFTATPGTISFAPGDTAFTIQVPVIGDPVPEDNETFALTLSGPFNVVLDRAVATGTILDDDDVTPPTVAVLAPNGGESVLAGAGVDLRWSAADNVAVSAVDLWLSRDDGATYESIAAGVPNTGLYTWTATAPLTQIARLKVVATDPHGQTGEDVSDAAWTIWNADGVDPILPLVFALEAVSPNPSRQAMQVRFALPHGQDVRMTVIDVRGRLMARLVDGALPAGSHVARWDGQTPMGHAPSGIYFVRIETPGFRAERRFVRLQ